ncbi:hypothetical protein [Mucilaginibacter lacusdianchii]|uniref:hypothetical protein n=1 Tax=Mucilaginibacter lacusdianchii TaxID=2684211 RepID=UPI00131B6EB4|nr:hypothetical protein [Mucilaginibacter sp. JXJ CY 39]
MNKLIIGLFLISVLACNQLPEHSVNQQVKTDSVAIKKMSLQSQSRVTDTIPTYTEQTYKQYIPSTVKHTS